MLQLPSHRFETMNSRPRLRAYLFKDDIILLGRQVIALGRIVHYSYLVDEHINYG